MEETRSVWSYYNEIAAAADTIGEKLGYADIGLVLGSGLNQFADNLENSKSLSFHEIPGMPITSVVGHAGQVVLGTVKGPSGIDSRILCFAGRVHAYEGWPPARVAFLSRVAAKVGCRLFVLTNSSGGCLPGMTPGSLMIIKDHIRNVGQHDPLLDLCDEAQFGPRHLLPDELGSYYSEYVGSLCKEAAKELGIDIHESTYCWTTGPTYETPSEVQAGIKLGCGAFGMSTVPEVLSSRGIGMEVFGLSLATNLACGLQKEALKHEDVTTVAKESKPKFESLLKVVLAKVDIQKLPSHNNLSHLSITSEPSLGQLAKGLRAHIWSSSEMIQGDVGEMKSLISRVDMVYFTITTASRLTASLKNSRVVLLSELSGFRQISSSYSSRFGKLVLGSLFGRTIVIVTCPRIEGFLPNETLHLLSCFRTLGLSWVIQDSVFKSSKGSDSPRLYDVFDALDRTFETYPFEESYSSYMNHSFPSSLISLCGHDFLSVGFFSGTSWPSKAEIASSEFGGCSGVSITSPFPSIFARFLRLKYSFVTVPFSDAYQEILDSEKTVTSLRNASVNCDVADEKTCAITSSHPTIHLSLNVQENPAHVIEAASYIKKSLDISSSPRCIVVLSGTLSRVFSKTVSSTIVPHWKTYCSSSELWSFTFEKAETLFVQRTNSLKSDDGLRYVVRILGQMGVKHILFTSSVASVSCSISPSSVVVLKDHINFSGANPLFGKNVDEWGVRFPDMSDVYDIDKRTCFESKLSCTQVVAGFMCNSHLDSFTDAKFASSLGSTVLMSTTIPAVIIARHMGMKISVVGFVEKFLDLETRKIVSGTCPDGFPSKMIEAWIDEAHA